MRIAFKLFLFLILTILTQIGGVVLLLSFLLHTTIDKRLSSIAGRRMVKSVCFTFLYFIFTFLLVPPAAKLFGRVRLPMTGHRHLKPVNMLTCLLNRNYVRPQMRDIVYQVADKMHQHDSAFVLCYLDANFPFVNRFPLIPHLSHNDGRKLDLAFVYRNSTDGTLTNSSPSFIGYGISAEPTAGELNTANFCTNCGYWQYGLLNKLVSQATSRQYVFDGKLTADIVKLFANDPHIGKIFIEPHLKSRLGLMQYDKIRFQGCRSVRHDDHIHVQLK
ncbi:MAG TPA: hypothetical protein VK174_10485 [Chitinophagales bacterium]|nr:hypothetical protein [Chitinophagales bacterium]